MSSSPARGARSIVFALAAVLAVLVGGVVAAVVASRPASADPPAPVPCDPAYPALPLRRPLTDPLVVTTGFPHGPAYNEFGLPVGARTFDPLGYMLVVHGGGWWEHGPGKVEQMRPEAAVWRARGWATLSVSYRPCAQSVGDVFAFYQQLRAAVGPDAPICATGMSAGGHLVLLLAMFFPDLDCVIAQAAPIDLVAVADQLAWPHQPTGPRHVYELAAGAFGVAPNLAFAGPQTWVANLQATRLLLATAVNDPLIPLDQARNLGLAVATQHPGTYVHVLELPRPADGEAAVPFVHGNVTPAILEHYRGAEDALVAPVLARASSSSEG